MSGTTATLHCPICGQTWKLPNEGGVLYAENITCSRCKNEYLVLISRSGRLVITAELVK